MVDFERMRRLMRYIPQAERKASERYQMAYARATKCTPTMGDGIHGGGGNHSQVEDGVIEMLEVREAVNAMKRELCAMRVELDSLLEALDEREASVMRMRYIRGLSIRRTSNQAMLSDRQVIRILKAAERKLAS